MPEGSYRPGAEAGYLRGDRKKAEVSLGKTPEIAHMLDDRHLGSEQCGVHRTRGISHIVDVERVNAY
jgi:hypothetical protein